MQQGGLGKEPAEAKTVSCGGQDFLDRPDLSVCQFVFLFVCLFLFVNAFVCSSRGHSCTAGCGGQPFLTDRHQS